MRSRFISKAARCWVVESCSSRARFLRSSSWPRSRPLDSCRSWTGLAPAQPVFGRLVLDPDADCRPIHPIRAESARRAGAVRDRTAREHQPRGAPGADTRTPFAISGDPPLPRSATRLRRCPRHARRWRGRRPVPTPLSASSAGHSRAHSRRQFAPDGAGATGRPQLAVGPRRPLTDGPNEVHRAVGDLADADQLLGHRILEPELALECRPGSGVRIDVNQRNRLAPVRRRCQARDTDERSTRCSGRVGRGRRAAPWCRFRRRA